MAPRKVRLLANLVKGLSATDAEAQLLLSPQRAAKPLLKLLRSAVANAKNNSRLDAEKAVIKEIRVDSGQMLKRWLPRAQGRATPIQKKNSRVTLVLAESVKAKPSRFKITKAEKIKKSELEKIKKEEEKAKEKVKASEAKETKPAPESAPTLKRVFRRKSI